MSQLTVIRILGVLLILFSLTLLPPVAISLIFDDGNLLPFGISFAVSLGLGALIYLPVKDVRRELRYRDGFLVVVLFWTVLASIGTVPLVLTESVHISFTDAFFESMSGLTTTGATVLTGLDSMPSSLLYYRQQLQWLGGMGIVVLAVAIMPMLGVGGMQLYRAETPGPMKDSKMTPRITETAKALWAIYLGLTVSCALAYYAAGMDWFDAISHSFSTIAIGGFSTHDASLGYFDSSIIESVAMVFMLIACANFSLHFVAFRNKSIMPYLSDKEFRYFGKVIILFGAVVVLSLTMGKVYDTDFVSVQQGLFHLVSILSTTGFTSSGFAWWPSGLPLLLIVGSFIGGCAGSTAGGLKVMRVMLLQRQARKEVVKLVHPNAVMSIKVGSQVIGERVLSAISAFFILYMFCFAMSGIALTLVGLDFVTAFSAAAACLNNLGPGLGEVSQNYSSINDQAKWILAFTMLLGRLELFTLLVLFTRTFWRN